MIRFATLFPVLLVLGTDACAAELGRLFYTPAQRTQLDTLRSRKNIAPPVPEVKDAPPVPDTLTYGGVVRRSDGRSTVWINNRTVNDESREARSQRQAATAPGARCCGAEGRAKHRRDDRHDRGTVQQASRRPRGCSET